MLRRGLALAFVSAPWEAEALREAGFASLCRRPRWMKGVVARVLASFPEAPATWELEDFLYDDASLQAALRKTPIPKPEIRRWVLPTPTMCEPVPPLADIVVPDIATKSELARFLGLAETELAWFADTRRQNARTQDARLHHYTWQLIAKRGGGHRLLEIPKPRLRAVQRKLCSGILDAVPISPAAHGYAKHRSIHTFVRPHVGRRVVVRMDLADFFRSIGSARVRAIFGSLGYPDEVADALAGLCTTQVPLCVTKALLASEGWRPNFATRTQWRTPHLPQGAPTSPALSNLAAFGLDRRLSALATVFEAQYTRYADDLAFSGDGHFAERAHSLVPYAAAAAMEEGFAVRFSKTRVMYSGKRQHLTGLVVNRKANVPRREYDRLRAILHRAASTGLDAQNRDGNPSFRDHLRGKIAYITQTNPARGARLERLWREIPGAES